MQKSLTRRIKRGKARFKTIFWNLMTGRPTLIQQQRLSTRGKWINVGNPIQLN